MVNASKSQEAQMAQRGLKNFASSFSNFPAYVMCPFHFGLSGDGTFTGTLCIQKLAKLGSYPLAFSYYNASLMMNILSYLVAAVYCNMSWFHHINLIHNFKKTLFILLQRKLFLAFSII